MVWFTKERKELHKQLSCEGNWNLVQRRINSAIELEWDQDEVEYSSYKDTSYTIGVWKLRSLIFEFLHEVEIMASFFAQHLKVKV